MNIKFMIIKAALALCISAGTVFSVGMFNPTTPLPATSTPSQNQEEVSSNISTTPESEIQTPSSELPVSSKPAPSSSTQTPTTPTKPSSNNTPSSKPIVTPPQSNTSSKPQVTTAYSQFQSRVLELVNIERAKVGLKALTLNQNLSKVATIKSQDMADKNYFDHTSPTYGSPFDMMKQFGITYRAAGENIAMGQTSPEQVMNGWMNSEGHRKNILSSSFTQIGIGIAKNSAGRLYWTQQFIG